MPLVYRIEEDEYGEGPFSILGASWCHDQLGCDPDDDLFHNDKDRFPNFYNDGMLDDLGADMRFGCACLDQLREWFPEPLARALCDHGFSLVTYEVDDDAISIGRRQAVFLPDRAREVDRQSPVTLFDQLPLPLAA